MNHGVCPDEQLQHYVCRKTESRIEIDGNLDKPCWRNAQRSPRFVDLVTGAPSFWDTRMASLWDEECLYVAYWVDEPEVRADLTKRDSLIYFENDVEIFVGGEDCYYELELNALGTVFEVFYIWQDAYHRGSRFDRPEFDLYSRDVDILGGYQDTLRDGKHPRGRRWAFRDWDLPGLRVATSIDGTINDPGVVDRGWTAELALPWRGMEVLAGSRPIPPQAGDVWRMDFSRFEALRYNGVAAPVSAGWALNSHGVYDSHIPECFSYVHFEA